MKYRLTLIFLLSLLFGSFSFNFLHYDAMLRADYNSRLDQAVNTKMIKLLYVKINELEQ